MKLELDNKDTEQQDIAKMIFLQAERVLCHVITILNVKDMDINVQGGKIFFVKILRNARTYVHINNHVNNKQPNPQQHKCMS